MAALHGRSRSRGIDFLGPALRDLRREIGWSQAELARRAGVTQGWISRIERGAAPRLSIADSSRLVEAMGARLAWTVEAPYLGDRRRQLDAGHARCVAYVVSRLRKAGWQVATEVEVGGDRSRGWIDILGYHPATLVLLVIEVKTELHDLGAVERMLGWYEREGWIAARRLGWRPHRSASALLLLATAAVDERVGENRRTFDLDFPGRATALRGIVAGDVPERSERHVAMFDPMSRRTAWLRPLRLDGRRTEPRYADYADFVRHSRARARPKTPSGGVAAPSGGVTSPSGSAPAPSGGAPARASAAPARGIPTGHGCVSRRTWPGATSD